MIVRAALHVAVLSLAASGCALRTPSDSAQTPPTSDCPVTQRSSPAFTPPAPYPAIPPGSNAGEFWYGTSDLWTALRSDGTWSALPHDDNGFSQKVFWWAQGYSVEREPLPALTVSGRRLDAGVERLIASSATNAYGSFGQAMLVGLSIPAPGCWEITGVYRGSELSFVVKVEP